MRTCWFCGQRFYPDEDYYWFCPEHLDDGLIDVWGKDGKDLNTAMGKLANIKLDDDMKKQLADSHVFPWLCESVLPLMEHKQLMNLLRKIAT